MKVSKDLPVKSAYLKTTVNLPGILVSDDSIVTTHKPGLVMYLTPIGLYLSNGKVRAVIPSATIKGVILDDNAVVE